jgi:DNA ligase 4
VLKGCDDPYFSLNSAKAFIKLKKDYIAGLGDTADFAIVGGHRDAKDEQELPKSHFVSRVVVWTVRVGL